METCRPGKSPEKSGKHPSTATLGGKREGLSKEGHRADALALGADERRDKLRKAAGRSKYPVIRRYPNEGTQHIEIYVIAY